MTDMAAPKLTRKELAELLRAEFPEMFNSESGYEVDESASLASAAFHQVVRAPITCNPNRKQREGRHDEPG